MIKSQLLPDGYATIRSRGLSRKKSRPASNSSDAYEIPIITPKFDSEVVYSGALNGHLINGDIKESYEDVENELDVIYKKPNNCDSNTSTFKTFKPNHSANSNGSDGSCKDLRQSNDYFHSMPYDMMLPPLKSPQYINQLNVMRSKTPTVPIRNESVIAFIGLFQENLFTAIVCGVTHISGQVAKGLPVL